MVIKTNYPSLSFETGNLYIFQLDLELKDIFDISMPQNHCNPNGIDSDGRYVKTKDVEYGRALQEIEGRNIFLVSLHRTCRDKSTIKFFNLKGFANPTKVSFTFVDKIKISVDSDEW